MKKESFSVVFLYQTIPGRMILKLLVNPKLSERVSVFLSSPLSRLVIPGFIRSNSIEMKRFVVPYGGYRSFNDFFTRRLKDRYKSKVVSDLISPCDGLLSVIDIDENCVINIKHSKYSVKELLRDKRLSKKYSGGTA
ncbi:MAG: phosphatidylserine decarboxylase, partial [Lachnospiraceae bacterium]|nr:phosphatidylserine decarboxylase [Lachnospiraceae bacterium]